MCTTTTGSEPSTAAGTDPRRWTIDHDSQGYHCQFKTCGGNLLPPPVHHFI